MSLAPVSDAPRTHWITASPGLGCSGNRSIFASKSLRVGLDPVVEERGPQPVDRRTAHAEVGVPPFVLVASVAVPLVGDADATGEADRLVHDHHLAVGPMVRLRQVAAGAADGTTGRARRRPPSCRSVAIDRMRTPRVQEDANPHAGSRTLRERLGERRPDLGRASRRTSGSRSCARPRRWLRASPGRSRCRCGGPRRGCPPSPGRRGPLRACDGSGRFGPGAPEWARSRPAPCSRGR